MPFTHNLETSVTIGNEGETSPSVVDPFRDTLKAISNSAYDLSALLAPPAGQTAYGRVATATAGQLFAYGIGLDPNAAVVNTALNTPYTGPGPGTVVSAVPTGLLLYTHTGMGMEIDEFVSWWFDGGGSVLYDGLLAAAVPTPAPKCFLLMCRPGEAAGWYKEAVTLKKFNDGKWSDGTPISWRGVGAEPAIHNAAFPNVATPAGTPNVSFLNDLIAGKYNCGEYNEPFGDVGPINGLFPSWPSVAGSIIAAGCPHYYLSSWHTTSRMRCLWVNRAFYAALPAQDKAWLEAASKASALANISMAMGGIGSTIGMSQQTVLQQLQNMGAIIHEHLPIDVLTRLRDVAGQVLKEQAALDLTGTYTTVLQHQQAFIRANAAKWAAYPDRRWRFQRKDYLPTFTPDTR